MSKVATASWQNSKATEVFREFWQGIFLSLQDSMIAAWVIKFLRCSTANNRKQLDVLKKLVFPLQCSNILLGAKYALTLREKWESTTACYVMQDLQIETNRTVTSKTRFYNYQPQPKYFWALSKIEGKREII